MLRLGYICPLVVLLLLQILFVQGKNGEVVLSGTRYGIVPSVKREISLLNGKAMIGGEYDYEIAKTRPKSFSLGYKEKIRGVPASARLNWNERPNIEIAVGTGESGQPKFVLDSTKFDSQMASVVKLIEYKITRFKGIVLEPKFKPREFAKKTKGLEIDVKAELNGDRAIVKSTLAPNTRPKIKFSFKIANDLQLDLQPLLGADGTKTKVELEKELMSTNKFIQQGTKLSASILESTLSLAATLPDTLAGLQGNLKPSISLDMSSPSSSLAFKLSQSFDI